MTKSLGLKLFHEMSSSSKQLAISKYSMITGMVVEGIDICTRDRECKLPQFCISLSKRSLMHLSDVLILTSLRLSKFLGALSAKSGSIALRASGPKIFSL